MQQQNSSRFFVFMLATLGFLLIFSSLHSWLFPRPKVEKDPSSLLDERKPDKPTPSNPEGLGGSFAREVQRRVVEIARQERRRESDLADRPTPESGLVTLGSVDPASRYHLGVKLDPRGAGVRSVLLNKFSRVDIDGRPASGELELVPGDVNDRIPANVLYHYADLVSNRPVDELGRVVWKASPVREEKLDDERTRQVVEFTAQTGGVEIVKKFSLTEQEYHLGLEITLTRKEATEEKGANRFRYQLTGARGLPIEGKWYTNLFRTSLIAQEQNGSIYRNYQDVRQIGIWAGGEEVQRDQNKFFRYAGTAVQYFASIVVIDPAEGQAPFIARARPTMEYGVTRGVIKSVAPDQSSFVVRSGNNDYTFQVEDWTIRGTLARNAVVDARVMVASTTDRYGRHLAEELTPEFYQQPLWVDDINVRLTSETLELEKDKPVTHRYLLYNGPAKVSLLGQMTGNQAVPQEVVSRYIDTYKLNTLTDYQSPGWIGNFSSAIYWTPLVINVTNLMHWVLNHLYYWLPNYGLCIILLTVIVRGLMFPLSLKQARTMQKMQALAPELKALNEKYKDDRQSMAQAQMDLYRKHGVNPFGTCWVVLLQMPIFMGLWYALQESIFFRLAPFWPTWIVNLAAPDMLFHWGRDIPLISRDYDYGGFLYLGPYLNLLPLFAVALMLIQQRMMTPPPTNEQEEANQRVMTIMMCVMGLLFYKIAAGVCIYFIASSLWGVAERQFLPKVKKPGEEPTPATTTAPALQLSGGPSTAASTAVTTAPNREQPADNRGRSRKKKGKRTEPQRTASTPESTEPEPTSALGKLASWWRKRRQHLAEWWAEVRRQAEKK